MALIACLNGGAELKETVLWTNPNPTAEYTGHPSNPVTVADFSGYDYIKFEYRKSTTDATTRSVLVSYDDFVGNNTVGTVIGTAEAVRNCNYSSDTSIILGYCYAFASANSQSSKTIPLNIIGVKV